MATSTKRHGIGSDFLDAWHTGVGIGIAGVIPMMAFSTVVGGKDLFPQFGLIPFAVFWGLLYVALTRIGPVERLAANLKTGVPLGVVYGFLVWWGPQAGKPVGEFVSVDAAVQVAAFGAVVGLLYALSTAGPGLVEGSEPTS
jgi:hypothetical protein